MKTNLLIWLTICLLLTVKCSYTQDTLKILSFGDLFLGSWAVEAVDTNGIDYPFRSTIPLIRSADLVMANLEGPFTDHSDTLMEKEYAFRVPPRMCQSLAAAGINAVTLANNHILDFGFPGLDETFYTLSSEGITAFGAGHSFHEAYQPAQVTIKGTNIALFGFSTTFPKEFWADSLHGGTAFPYQQVVTNALSNAQHVADLIIVHIHWGEELQPTPKEYQIDLAHLFVDSGADVVFGHHAHVPLGVEIYNGAPIFYGLGNFAFGSYSAKAKGMGAEVRMVENRITSGRIIPLNVNNIDVEFSPTPLEGDDKRQFIQHIVALSDSLNPRPVIDHLGNLIMSD